MTSLIKSLSPDSPIYFNIVGNKENIDVAIGVSFSGFYGEYDAILHPLTIKK